jgi:dihydroorotate dehydrogenase electron transfer subunit
LRTRHEIVEVKRVVEETPCTNTLFFDSELVAKPGQFVMVWIPGVDEIPMSLSFLGSEKGVTVRDIGDATKALASKEVGDRIGIRGPFGNPFSFKPGKMLAVGGGSGIATIAPAVEFASGEGLKVDVCLGASTKNELLFRERLKRSADVQVSTDDGSEGFEGFVSKLVEEILGEKKYDQMVTCGPEPMMKRLLELSMEKEMDFQASLERFMKCGIGICDSCAIDSSLVCTDGPVFDGDTLINLDDFGKFARDSSGKKVSL